MMCHTIKVGCKKISTSVDTVEAVISDYMSPRCGRDLEDGKPIFLHDTGPWWCITIPSLVAKGSAVEEISSRWTFTGILNLTLILTLTTTEQSNLFTRHSSLWWVIELVSWYFEPSQPQRITSELNTNFNQPPSYSNNKSLNHKSLSLVFFIKHNPHKTRAPDMLFTSSEYVIIKCFWRWSAS